MAFEAYAAAEEYAALYPGEEPGPNALAAASRHIDRATFGRVRALGGPAALTAYQRELLAEAACRQAKFEAENAALFGWAVGSYAINGVSMKFGAGGGVRYVGGVAMPGEVTTLLEQTGLCGRLAR